MSTLGVVIVIGVVIAAAFWYFNRKPETFTTTDNESKPVENPTPVVEITPVEVKSEPVVEVEPVKAKKVTKPKVAKKATTTKAAPGAKTVKKPKLKTAK